VDYHLLTKSPALYIRNPLKNMCITLLKVLKFAILFACRYRDNSLRNSSSIIKVHLFLALLALSVSSYTTATENSHFPGETTETQDPEKNKKPGYHAAGFRIRPSVSVSGQFDDNIFATDTLTEADFITIISPRINLDSTWDRHSLRIKLGAELGRYAEFDAENYNDYWASTDGKYNLGPATDIFGGLGLSSEHEDRDSPDASSGGLSPTTYRSKNAHVGIKTTRDMTTYRIGATYEKLDFDNILTADGGSIINNDRDRDLIGIGVRATHQLDTSHALFAQALYDVREYDQSVDQDGYARDSDGYRLAAGFKNDYGNGNRAEAYIGLLAQDYDDNRFDSVNKIDFGGNFAFGPDGKTMLSGKLLRTLNETTVAGSSSYLHTAVSGRLEYRISPQLIPHIKLGYAQSDFMDSGRKDNIFSTEAGLKYYLARNAFITTGYRHVNRDSNDFGLTTTSNDYQNNSFFLAFTSQGYPVMEPLISDFSTTGFFEIGVVLLSDDSLRFGRFSGLDTSGTHLNGNALVESTDGKNNWATIEGHDLGLESRSLDLEWGSQGNYSAYLHFDQLPARRFTGKTIFDGVGSPSLSLPASGWTVGDETSDLADLASSLQDVEIGTLRKKLGVGSTFIRNKNWTLTLGYETETKEGFEQIAGVVGHAPGDPARAVMLPAPVDYTTNILKASMGYAKDQSMFNLAYQSSFFMNNLKALNWQNPFDSTGPRGVEGSISLAPDNQFHQISLSGAHALSTRTRLTGVASYAAMYQDDEFLPDSVDPALIPNPLPRNSLDGEVYQTNALLALSSRPLSGLNLKASYRLQKRDNQTPVDSYTYHVNDSRTGGSSSTPATDSNAPYSYERRTLDFSGGYRLNRIARLNGNIARESFECSPCEVNKTTEDEANLRLKLTPDYDFQVTLRGGVSSRDGSGYQTIAGENPLLRKYNISDRERTLAGVDLSYQASDNLAFGANLEISEDDYDATTVGLTSSRQAAITLDASYQYNDQLSAHAYIGREMIESKQSGSQEETDPAADWFVDNDDNVDSLGFGVKWKKSHKLDIGVDYAFNGSRGETAMTSTNTNPPVSQFPDLKTDFHTLKLYADYKLRSNTSLKFSYLYEKYDVNDWSIDGVSVDTIPEVLLLGEDNPGYAEHVIGLSVISRF